MVGIIAAILVSAAVIKGGDTSGTDEFIARQAWLYVAIVASAYFISRGLAKSGTSEPYTDDARRLIDPHIQCVRATCGWRGRAGSGIPHVRIASRLPVLRGNPTDSSHPAPSSLR